VVGSHVVDPRRYDHVFLGKHRVLGIVFIVHVLALEYVLADSALRGRFLPHLVQQVQSALVGQLATLLLVQLGEELLRQEDLAVVLGTLLGSQLVKLLLSELHGLLVRVVETIRAEDSNVLQKQVLVSDRVEVFADVSDGVVGEATRRAARRGEMG